MRRFESNRPQWCKTCQAETDHYILYLIDEDRELAECMVCIKRESEQK